MVDTTVMLYPIGRMNRQHLRNSVGTSRHLTNEVIRQSGKRNHELHAIDDRLDRLSLLCEAMWELLKDVTDLSDEDLAAQLIEVDERDGRRNLRRQRTAQPCDACGSRSPAKNVRCQVCGEPLTQAQSLFDIV